MNGGPPDWHADTIAVRAGLGDLDGALAIAP